MQNVRCMAKSFACGAVWLWSLRQNDWMMMLEDLKDRFDLRHQNTALLRIGNGQHLGQLVAECLIGEGRPPDCKAMSEDCWANLLPAIPFRNTIGWCRYALDARNADNIRSISRNWRALKCFQLATCPP